MNTFTFDENNNSTVILTKHGADVINQYSKFLNKWSNTDIQFKEDYKEDDEYSAEMHTIMHIFYSEHNKGTEKCFKQITVIKD